MRILNIELQSNVFICLETGRLESADPAV
jgi:hypothetical protein